MRIGYELEMNARERERALRHQRSCKSLQTKDLQREGAQSNRSSRMIEEEEERKIDRQTIERDG